MINLFRKFRKSLIQSSSVKKYLLYAIGEILLVMVGILLALQVNNWNEGRKERRIEKQYIQSLMTDLEGQRQSCSNLIKGENIKVDQGNQALLILRSGEFQDQLDTFYYLLRRIVPRWTLIEYNPTYEDLKSTGNLRLIKHDELRKAIIDYYHSLEFHSTVIALNNQDVDHSYKMAMNKNELGFYHDRQGNLKNEKLIDPVSRFTAVSLVEQKMHISRLHSRRVQNLVKRTDKLLEQLQDYLDNH